METLAHKIEFAKDKILKTKELIEDKSHFLSRLRQDFSEIDFANENAQKQAKHNEIMQFMVSEEKSILHNELERWEDLFDELIRQI